MIDPERATRPKPVEIGLGFEAASWFLASDRDSESLIFRKFNKLSARNLLYLQCEVLALEKKLQDQDCVFSNSREADLEQAARTWETLISQFDANELKAVEMMAVIREIRVKMKEYHEALKLQSDIAALHRPEERVLQVTRNWLKVPVPVLGGLCKYYLDDEDDLVALKMPAEMDILSKGLRACWPGKDELSRDGNSRIRRYDEGSITKAVGIISIILAAILLLGAIIGFNFVTTWGAKLGMICTFTIAFALVVGLTTNAKRAEIFAATAAYAAVLVVFVSNGDLSGNQQCCRAAAQQ